MFAAAIIAAFGAPLFWPQLVELAANPVDVCDTLIADGLDTRLLVLRRPLRPGVPLVRATVLRATTLSSGMKRVARDGQAWDLFDFVDWYRPWPLALQRWREAPPLAEVQDEREIALEGMLTRCSSEPQPVLAPRRREIIITLRPMIVLDRRRERRRRGPSSSLSSSSFFS